ncbi:DUF7269 family protein [Haloglomus litoreum]|uniref:DUF7269 family protein n=1 Tax=Haloglomus litoreum TaxID=3034026 RepID=UPI0023E81579|nr:hypothetical protein [Haloglomus sp. DT116]
MSTSDGLGRTGTALAVVAVLAILVAVVAVVAPGAVPVPPAVEALLDTIPAAVVLSLLAFVGLLLLFARSRRSRASELDPLLAPAEGGPRAPALGSGFDGDLAAATDLDATRERRLVERENVENIVRDAAVDAYAVEVGVDRETAHEAVVTGDWTGDRRASALVGGPEAPTPSWGQWLFDLLRSESAYHRRVRHAVAEIERLLTDGPTEEREPDGTGDRSEADTPNDRAPPATAPADGGEPA